MGKTEKLNLFEVGRRVKQVREEKHLSGEALGLAIGYSQNAISKIECGKTAKVNVDAIRAIARTCEVSEDYLLLRSNFKTRKDEIESLIGQIQDNDVMWTAFIRHIAFINGYTMEEANRANVSPTDLESPYLEFEKDGSTYYFSLSETNDFIREVEKHAALSLQMKLERMD